VRWGLETKLLALSLAIPVAPAPAQDAIPSLTLVPGETVTARVASDPPGFVILSRNVAASGASEGAAVAEGTIRFAFTSRGRESMLQVENGYDRVFHYRAVIERGDRSMPTTICTVVPHITGFESWPHAIDRLELSSPRFVETTPGMISCQ